MGKTFLIDRVFSGSILHHCDKFININWIKFGGSFEDISLVIKLSFVSRANYYIYILSSHCQSLQINSTNLYKISPMPKTL